MVLFIGLVLLYFIRILKEFNQDSKKAKERIARFNLKHTTQARITSCVYVNTNFLQREDNPDYIKIYAEKGILYVFFSPYYPISFLTPPHIITKEAHDFNFEYSLVKLHKTLSGEVVLKFKSRKKFPYLSYSLTISNMTAEDYAFIEAQIVG